MIRIGLDKRIPFRGEANAGFSGRLHIIGRNSMKFQVIVKIVIIIAVVYFTITGEAICMDPDDVVRLKEAGVGDAVIETLVREKSLETAAFTVEGILKMKKAGVEDGAMVKIIEEKSFIRGREEVTYGKDMRPATRATVSDIMELKKAGISDGVISTIVENQAIDPTIEEQRRAMEILKHMGLIIDVR